VLHVGRQSPDVVGVAWMPRASIPAVPRGRAADPVPQPAANTAPYDRDAERTAQRRNRFTEAVAVPISRRSTAFWIADDQHLVDESEAEPEHGQVGDGRPREPSTVDSSAGPRHMTAKPTTGKTCTGRCAP